MLLLETTTKYRVESEQEVSTLIEEARQMQGQESYELTKHNSAFKTKKAKGEIVDAWYVVSLTKKYNEEK